MSTERKSIIAVRDITWLLVIFMVVSTVVFTYLFGRIQLVLFQMDLAVQSLNVKASNNASRLDKQGKINEQVSLILRQFDSSIARLQTQNNIQERKK